MEGEANSSRRVGRAVHQVALEQPQQTTDFLVVDREDVKPSQQWQKAVSKAWRALRQQKRSVGFKRLKFLLLVFRALVRPNVAYLVQAWRPYLVGDKKRGSRFSVFYTLVWTFDMNRYEQMLSAIGFYSIERPRDRVDELQCFKIAKTLAKIQGHRGFLFQAEKQIVCHMSGELLEQATGRSDRSGVSARIQSENKQLMATCVSRGQCVNCRTEKAAERKASHWFSSLKLVEMGSESNTRFAPSA